MRIPIRRFNDKHELHNEDGPAELLPDGTQRWYICGKLHNEDGPAVILPNGRKEWWINGKQHRKNGPATITENNEEEWWIDGKQITNKIKIAILKKFIVAI